MNGQEIALGVIVLALMILYNGFIVWLALYHKNTTSQLLDRIVMMAGHPEATRPTIEDGDYIHVDQITGEERLVSIRDNGATVEEVQGAMSP